ncbi:MAG: hypothetical protein ACTHXA_09540 [Gulosibacter sp.]|uniref:hypothetical protein n=1 Tax=Gulosibacter sp. TaxID=2817531 RepID=UPI003F8F275D
MDNPEWHQRRQPPHDGQHSGDYDGQQGDYGSYGGEHGQDYSGQHVYGGQPYDGQGYDDQGYDGQQHVFFDPNQGQQSYDAQDQTPSQPPYEHDAAVANQSLGQGTAHPFEEQDEAPEEEPPKRRGVIWLVSILAVVLVAVVVGGFVFFNNTNETVDSVFNFEANERGPKSTTGGKLNVPQVNDPAESVREYLTHIEEGDSAGASQYVDPGTSLADNDVLATEALDSAQTKIRVVSTETIDEQDGDASVRATMSLEGAEFEHIFTLALVDTQQDGETVKTWRIDDPLVTPVEVATDGVQALQIGDFEAGVGNSAGSTSVYLYPGIYSFSVNAGEYFSATGNQNVRVTTPSDAPDALVFSVEPNDSFEQAVLEQVQDRIYTCTQVPGNMDEECPSITKNTALEELTVVEQASGFQSFTGTSFVSSSATIGVVDSATDSNPSPSQRTSTFNVYGDITIVDGTPQVTNLRSY